MIKVIAFGTLLAVVLGVGFARAASEEVCVRDSQGECYAPIIDISDQCVEGNLGRDELSEMLDSKWEKYEVKNEAQASDHRSDVGAR